MANLKVGWLVQYQAPHNLLDKLEGLQWFTPKEPDAFFNRISSIRQPLYHPIEIGLTNLFHRHLRNHLASKFGLKVVEKNFPYCGSVGMSGSNRFGATVQIFLPNIVSVRIRCFEPFLLDPESAFAFRDFQKYPVLKSVSDYIVEKFLEQAYGKGVDCLAKTPLPMLHVDVEEEGHSFLEENQQFLAALLINDQNFKDSDSSMFGEVLGKNEDHNKKANRVRRILIDKQGVLSVVSRSAANLEAIEQEVRKKENLYELGSALRWFYEVYPEVRQTYEAEMDYLFLVSEPLITRPKLTIQMSVANSLAWDVIMRSFHLSDAYSAAKRISEDDVGVRRAVDSLPIFGYTKGQYWNSVRAAFADAYRR